MKNKLYIFGSCFSHGLELWEEVNIENYSNMDLLMAAMRSEAFKYWEAFHHDTATKNPEITEKINFNRKHSWTSYITEYDVINHSAVGQRNLENYMKLVSMLENNEIDNDSKVIIEITQPGGGKLVSQGQTIKSVNVDQSRYFCRNKNVAIELTNSYNNFETDRFNAWNDLLVLELILFKLKERGIDYKYFFYNKDDWYQLLNTSKPFILYTNTAVSFEDSFNNTLKKIINKSLLTDQDDIILRSFETLPQGHLSLKGHRQFGEFINLKLRDF